MIRLKLIIKTVVLAIGAFCVIGYLWFDYQYRDIFRCGSYRNCPGICWQFGFGSKSKNDFVMSPAVMPEPVCVTPFYFVRKIRR